MTAHISHGASGDWFVVLPPSSTEPLRHAQQVQGLRRAKRRVLTVPAWSTTLILRILNR